MDGLLGVLVQGQGVGRAREVARGQDGHDDGSNMMCTRESRSQGGGWLCLATTPSLGLPWASQSRVRPGTNLKLQAWHRHSEHAEGKVDKP